MNAWIGGRVVLVDTITTDRDKAFDLALEFPGFKDVQGPLINGIMAFTWEDEPDAVSNQELIDRTVRICECAQTTEA